MIEVDKYRDLDIALTASKLRHGLVITTEREGTLIDRDSMTGSAAMFLQDR